MVPLSVLDLSPIIEGHDAAHALANTLDLARHAEQWGFHRYWLAEHHNMPGIASAATSIVIAHVAQGTNTIRVGAGGIMLPNHSPLAIAEQFGTLESLFPGRIDLGLGRAPGSDGLTARALRRSSLVDEAEAFPQDVLELIAYFRGETGPVRAVPGAGLHVPIWILGSSTFGAQLAAALGLPYSFASHFAPTQMMQAIEIYRAQFRPSEQLDRPYVMLGFNVFAADTDEDAQLLFTSLQQAFVNLRRGMPGRLPPPVAGFGDQLSPAERAMLAQALSSAAVGSRDTVRRGIDAFVARTAADELIVTSQIYDHAARLKSFEITASLA
ncbi:MAG: class flavin-dependent oxidoreductase [Acidobacteria bacterium]|nr:class flavin-dependent oxidoreductase [Acidobacteriota bacterium]